MKNKKSRKIIQIFKDVGMTIESGANYSVRGQIAQLLNGCEHLIEQDVGIINEFELKKPVVLSRMQIVHEFIRNNRMYFWDHDQEIYASKVLQYLGYWVEFNKFDPDPNYSDINLIVDKKFTEFLQLYKQAT